MALARYLVSQGAEVVVTDHQQPGDLEREVNELLALGVECEFGGHPLHMLDECDLVCPSAGVPLSIPLLIEAQSRGIPFSNDSQIFLEGAPCPVVGITGSAGKTTTTALVGKMAESEIGSQRTWIGGNIGNPLISNLVDMASDHFAVVELSSFQLEIMTRSPQVAAVLNLTPNHLDRHLTMEAYINAKKQILVHQTPEDIAVLSCDDPVTWELKDSVQGKLIVFGSDMPESHLESVYLKNGMICYWNGKKSLDIIPRDKIQLKGEHNLMNVIAACAIAIVAGISFQAIRLGIEGFSGVNHRLEFVRSWGGADWYNDSIATAPERAIAAIKSFDEPIVLLAGGRDKDLPWKKWAALVLKRVDHLIIFGEAREIIEEAINTFANMNGEITITSCNDIRDAVVEASEVIKPGDVVLLSPGGTSFDEFRDFAERGEWFKKWVNKLQQ
jgi:UDP-N-acetylmuramoylalanine--D-glutamate ligase